MASSKNSAETPTAKHKGWRSVLSNAGLLVAAPLFAILLTMFVFQSYEVEGMSMEHTLQNKDRLVVLKIPRTVSRLTHNAYTPKRYDIIVFNSQLLQKQLIKRVIGLPGDRVVIADGHVTVYNAEHRAGYRPDTGQEYAAGLAEWTPLLAITKYSYWAITAAIPKIPANSAPYPPAISSAN
jgi:signal peptidase I